MSKENILNEPPRDLAKRLNGTEVVYIGCKLPHGLWLEIITPVPKEAPGWNPMPTGQRIKLAGSKTMRDPGTVLVNQGQHLYALTPVPKEFWERWLKANRDLEFVKQGLVFALESKEDAVAKAKEGASIATGLEGVRPDDPSKDPRAPRTYKPEEKVTTDKSHLDTLYENLGTAA